MRRFSLLLISLTIFPGMGQAAPLPYRVVAHTGDIASGTPGRSFTSLFRPLINEHGIVAFGGKIQDGGAHPGGDGLWTYDPYRNISPTLITPLEGQLTGSADSIIDESRLVNHFDFDNNGGVIYASHTLPQGGWDLISVSGNEAMVVASEGSKAVGFANATYKALQVNRFDSNSEGQVVFESTLSGSDAYEAIWRYHAGSVELLLSDKDAFPSKADKEIGHLDFPKINRNGQAAVIADYRSDEGPGWITTILVEKDEAWHAVAAARDPTPGVSGGVFSGIAYDYRFNGEGKIAFDNFISGEGITPDNNQGIWVGDQEGLELIARLGDPAPGTNGAWFADSPLTATVPISVSSFNDESEVLFWSTLVGEDITLNNRGGLWKWSDRTITKVVQMGDPAPGTDGVFASEWTGLLNNAGQVVFNGKSGPEWAHPLNRDGLWATTPSGVLQLVVQQGDSIFLDDESTDPSELVVEEIEVELALNRSSSITGFNDRGELAVKLSFTDGSEGIVVFDTTVPEPSSLVGAMLLLGLMAVRSRSHRKDFKL